MKNFFFLAPSVLLAASGVSASPILPSDIPPFNASADNSTSNSITGSLTATVSVPNVRAANSTTNSTTNSTSTSLSATQVLQFALTLEHLESTFYQEALGKFDASAFQQAGYADWVRGRFEQIAEHEQSHVAFLTEALGNNSVQACNYYFPYDDPKSFAALSYMLESVGESAYLGGSKYLVNDTQALDAAAAILVVEARHSSWIQSSVNESYPWSGAFDTPLTPKSVYSLASQFIVECPSSNPQLPLTAFPALNVSTNDGKSIAAGSQLTLQYNKTSNATEYLAFFSGLNTTFAQINNSEATVPENLQGFVYAVVSSSNSSVTDANTVAGPIILSFPFDAFVNNA